MDAETVVRLALEKLKEIAEIFDQFEGKDETTFINMSVSDKYIFATLISSKKCGCCNKTEPVVHSNQSIDRKAE